jgi:hypothetical protein
MSMGLVLWGREGNAGERGRFEMDEEAAEIRVYFRRFQDGTYDLIVKGAMTFDQAMRLAELGNDGRIAAEPEFPLTSFYDSLSEDQKRRLQEYDGPENHGDPAFLRREKAPPTL